MMGKRSNRGNGKGLTFVAYALAADVDECILWPFYRMRNGYGQVGTHCGMALAHRYVCELAHGPAPTDKPQVLHGCGKRSCVNPRHLRWGSQVENEADKLEHGTWFTRMGGAKLNADIVRSIRHDAMIGNSYDLISEKYRTPKSTIAKVVRKETWKHV
jgi:hypothetical protein|nr:MAG TPA: endonuclease [Caudoviricetes sp.]